MSEPTNADYAVKVWWVPQVPMKAFEFPVPDIKAGALLCDALAKYDLFQYENHVKPDYSNAGGVAFLDEEGEWCDVDTYDEDDIAYAESVLTQRAHNGRDADA
jgi:hypothetical protein